MDNAFVGEGGGFSKIKIDYNREMWVRFHVIMKYKTFTANIIIFTILAQYERTRPSMNMCIKKELGWREGGGVLLHKHSLLQPPRPFPLYSTQEYVDH